jgi:hypothetical protein
VVVVAVDGPAGTACGSGTGSSFSGTKVSGLGGVDRGTGLGAGRGFGVGSGRGAAGVGVSGWIVGIRRARSGSRAGSSVAGATTTRGKASSSNRWITIDTTTIHSQRWVAREPGRDDEERGSITDDMIPGASTAMHPRRGSRVIHSRADDAVESSEWRRDFARSFARGFGYS